MAKFQWNPLQPEALEVAQETVNHSLSQNLIFSDGIKLQVFVAIEPTGNYVNMAPLVLSVSLLSGLGTSYFC